MADDWHCKQIPNGSNPLVVCEREALRDEIERLRGEADEAGQLLERMTVLLHRIANALHGGPRPNGLHSWHDLPELAAQLREEARRG